MVNCLKKYNICRWTIIGFLANAAFSFLSVAYAGPEEVVLQLKWKHQFQFAGYYAAIEKGYYRQAGLEVRLEEGGPKRDAIKAVAGGQAQYGVSNSQVLLHRIAGEPLVVLAAIFQHSPLVFVTRRETGIKTPQDMIGKLIRMTRDSRDVELHAALLNEGISLDRVNIVDSWVKRQDYFDPKVDGASAYLTNEVFYFIEENVPYQIINPLVYGIDFYGDCLITSEQELSENPKRVKAFLEASLKGWDYAMDHPEEIIALIQEKYPSSKSISHLRFEAESMRSLILPDLVEMGHMNPGRWDHIAQTFAQFGWINPEYSLEGFLYDPNPKVDLVLLRWIVGIVSFLAVLAVLISMIMFVFNRRLGREIADRKLAEEALREGESRLRQIIDLVPHFIFVKNREGKFLLANQAVADVYGTTVEGVIGKTDADFKLPEAEIDHFREDDLKVIETRQPLFIPEEPITDSKEQVRILQSTKIPFIVSGTQSVAVLGVAIDITERKQAEAERKLLEDQLKQSQKMEAVGILAGGIAHDFNNLLQAISGYTQLLLLDKKESNPDRQNLTAIQQSSDRAAQLVRQLLLFSRKAETDRRSVDLNREVEQACLILERTIPKMIDIEFQPGQNLWVINADTVQIEQILFNLAVNAADAMPEGGTFIIKTENANLDRGRDPNHPGVVPGQYVLLTVSDNGHGMDEDTLDKIFDPFFTTKEVGKGTGLGLASVYGIVKGHGGHIVCSSRVGLGTTFRIYLPAVGRLPVEESANGDGFRLPGGSETILLVDDEEQIRDFSSQILEKFGYTVLTASSGEEALDIYFRRHEAINLVVMDIGMPGMGGLKCLVQIIERTPEAKVLIASGYSDGQVKKALEAGAAGYVGKPYGMDDLLEKVRGVLDDRAGSGL